ncbi:MAG: chemotaxis protein CheC [Planctomycetales bacterium]|nr:chemotaxis protein CheC [bacterium]UNM08329.1 MAG: chemotaxis protein CheC [Planctomycetales bacterium]
MGNSAYDLSDMQKDTIREVSNIGMGNAATSLSQLINTRVDITVPFVKVVPDVEISRLLGGEEVEVCASYVQVVGDIRGHLVMIFRTSDAQMLLNQMAPSADMTIGESEMARSALQELGNILASSFLRSLADMTSLLMHSTVPAVAQDFAGSIVSYVVSNMYELSEKIMIVDTHFEVGGDHIDGQCVFIPEPGSLTMLLESLGVANL